MDVSQARRLVSLLPPKSQNFFIRYPPRNPALRTVYSQDDKSLSIAKKLHDFQSVPASLHKPVLTETTNSTGKPVPTVLLPFQNPFKPTRDPRSGKFHAPRYSLRRQADIIKLAMRFGVAELLPPSAKMDKLLNGRKRPMAGTLKPKGSYEERTRRQYVERKQKSLEDSLRVVAMRKMVLSSSCIKLTFSGETSRNLENKDRRPLGINQNGTSDNNVNILQPTSCMMLRFIDLYCPPCHFS